jgi:hypothetical protein
MIEDIHVIPNLFRNLVKQILKKVQDDGSEGE